MKIFVCKVCGRALEVKDDQNPSFCYSDATDMLEQINFDESVAMDIMCERSPGWNFVFSDGQTSKIEFPADIRFNPFTGDMNKNDPIFETLSEYQFLVMRKMLNEKEA